MYVFSRSRVANPAQFGAAVAWAEEIAHKTSSITGVEISAWASVLSPEAGTLSWTAWFENLGQWEAASDKLAVDQTYNDMVAGADHLFTGPVADSMAMVLTPLPENPAPATYVDVVSAVATHGHLREAIQHGVALAEAASKLAGTATLFGTMVNGPYGGVGWLTGAPDIASLEAMQTKINGDASFLELVDTGGHLFQPGASQSTYRRIA
jgi:hypothetical protein